MVRKHISTTTCESEADFKAMVIRGLEFSGFHTQKHEDRYGLGIPDLSYGVKWVNGWIEFKWASWQLERTQPRWLRQRALSGGHTFLLRGDPDGITLVEWTSMTKIIIHESMISDWIGPLATMLTLHTPFGKVVSQLHTPDQMYPPSLLQGLSSLGWQEIEGFPDKSFPSEGSPA
jgi:hypothetical protein